MNSLDKGETQVIVQGLQGLSVLFLFQTDSINSANSLDEGEAQVVVQGLQEELIMVRLKEAENSATIKNLRNKIEDLEQVGFYVDCQLHAVGMVG